MAYVKLDTGILNSTVWIENVKRNMFLTALLLAEPFETAEPIPQLEVRSLDKTGFEIPPGWYGFVSAAGIGIARQAGIDPELGLQALEIMGNPEPESRSQEFGGRRLIRVNGGYIVLNFQKYRDKDHTNSERQRRYRERQKGVTPLHNGDVPKPPRKPRKSITPLRNGSDGTDDAQRVMEERALSDETLLPIIHKALQVYAKKQRIEMSVAADTMIARLSEFDDLGNRSLLRHSWGLDKFIGQGHWVNTGSWPLDKDEMERQRRL